MAFRDARDEGEVEAGVKEPRRGDDLQDAVLAVDRDQLADLETCDDR
jgi:hypothetical protein